MSNTMSEKKSQPIEYIIILCATAVADALALVWATEETRDEKLSAAQASADALEMALRGAADGSQWVCDRVALLREIAEEMEQGKAPPRSAEYEIAEFRAGRNDAIDGMIALLRRRADALDMNGES